MLSRRKQWLKMIPVRRNSLKLVAKKKGIYVLGGWKSLEGKVGLIHDFGYAVFWPDFKCQVNQSTFPDLPRIGGGWVIQGIWQSSHTRCVRQCVCV